MGLTSVTLFSLAFLSFYSPIICFLIFCIVAISLNKFLPFNQIALCMCAFNLYKALIPDGSIYSDFIVYEQIPRDADLRDISSYWASSYDYIFAIFIKILHITTSNFHLGFLCLLTLYLLIVFNLVYKIRDNLQDAIFFLLCFSYTSSFQLTRYTLGATLAYFLYIWRPRGVLVFLSSAVLLLQVHFYSLVNYMIFRLNYKFVAVFGLLVLLVIFTGMDNLFIHFIPELGKYSGNFYSPSYDPKLLLYIFLSSFIFFIKGPCQYIDPLKKMVVLSSFFFFFNSTFSERLLVLPFNIFLGLIFSFIILKISKLLYFIPFLLFFYRYILL